MTEFLFIKRSPSTQVASDDDTIKINADTSPRGIGSYASVVEVNGEHVRVSAAVDNSEVRAAVRALAIHFGVELAE